MSVKARWCRVVCVLLAFATASEAQEASGYRMEAARNCLRDVIDAHVRAQFAKYGPLSRDREYFGFIFSVEGVIGSAVIHGRSCPNPNSCSIDTGKVAPLIPKGARVLGEWHSHPQASKAGLLSVEDLRGARANRHIRCYAAYYSQPNGNIYAWDPVQILVPNAMASRVLIGRYPRETPVEGYIADSVDPVSAAIIAAHENPGTQCLSTNTNVHTAATTKKCCRRSTTSHSKSAQAAARTGSKSSCPRPSSG
jgi:hypothetical protein